jgi:hypothetical protein
MHAREKGGQESSKGHDKTFVAWDRDNYSSESQFWFWLPGNAVLN